MTPFFTPNELIVQLKTLGVHLEKSRGQCFLIDRNIAEYIVDSLNPTPEDSVLEIGPGLGTLTDFLALKAGKLIIIEQDKKFYEYQKEHFQNKAHVSVIHADALNAEWQNFNKIISNVPYQISGPLFAKIAGSTIKNGMFEKGVFMVQKEFAQRLVAKPNSADYGRLSVVYSLFFEVRVLKQVSSNVFLPKPEVQSTIISIEPKKTNWGRDNPMFSYFNSLMWFLHLVFPYKNKILRRAIKDAMNGMNMLKEEEKEKQAKLKRLLSFVESVDLGLKRIRALAPKEFIELIIKMESS
jgi:16S rRNA (adenine1518-N6/adenine1519-N6)-dimethyltransferase